MERRGRKPVFFSDRSQWLVFDEYSYENDFPITKRDIRNALTDSSMLSDQADRVLSSADEKKLKEVRNELEKERKQYGG